MKIKTRDFGEMEVNQNEILHFVSPVYGFDHLKDYVVFSDDEAGAGIMWLQSIEDQNVCFVLLDPAETGVDYDPEISEDVRKMMEIDKNYVLRLIAVIPDDFRNTTVNLKSPIIINQEKKYGAQIILDADLPLRWRLFPEEGSAI